MGHSNDISQFQHGKANQTKPNQTHTYLYIVMLVLQLIIKKDLPPLIHVFCGE